MLKQASIFMAAAVASLTTYSANAATVTYTYANVQTSTTAGFTAGTVTNVTLGAGNVVTVAPGSFVRFSLRATVSGNPNTVAGDYTDAPQPTNLGLSGFGFDVTDSSAATITPRLTNGNPAVTVNPLFNTITAKGVLTGANIAGLSGGNILNTLDASDPALTPRLSIGTSGTTADQVFSNLTYNALAPGTATLTLTAATANNGFAIGGNRTGDESAGLSPTYANRTFTTGDLQVGPASLVITVAAVPEPVSLGVFGVVASGLIARRRRA